MFQFKYSTYRMKLLKIEESLLFLVFETELILHHQFRVYLFLESGIIKKVKWL